MGIHLCSMEPEWSWITNFWSTFSLSISDSQSFATLPSGFPGWWGKIGGMCTRLNRQTASSLGGPRTYLIHPIEMVIWLTERLGLLILAPAQNLLCPGHRLSMYKCQHWGSVWALENLACNLYQCVEWKVKGYRTKVMGFLPPFCEVAYNWLSAGRILCWKPPCSFVGESSEYVTLPSCQEYWREFWIEHWIINFGACTVGSLFFSKFQYFGSNCTCMKYLYFFFY